MNWRRHCACFLARVAWVVSASLATAWVATPASATPTRVVAAELPATFATSEPVTLAERATPVNPSTRYWIDETGQATASQADQQFRAGAFSRDPLLAPVRLHPNKAVWQRFEVVRGDQQLAYLRSNSPGVDWISLHWQDRDARWKSQVGGDHISASRWSEPSRVPLFKLPLRTLSTEPGSGQPEAFYVRVAHAKVPIMVSLTLLDARTLQHEVASESLLLGLFFGVGALVLGFCLYQAWRFRDLVYASYAGLSAAMLLMQLTFTGLGARFLWSDSPLFADQIGFLIVEIYAVSGLLFLTIALSVKRLSRRVFLGLRLFMCLGVALLIYHLFSPSYAAFKLSNWYAQAAMAVLIALCLWAHRQGERYALWYMLGFAPVLIGAVPALLRNAGVISAGFWSHYGIMIGASLEIAFLFFILGARSVRVRETGIRERALNSRDPLTGLIEAQLFKTRLYETLTRCRRYKHACVLMRVNLDNHGWFTKEHSTEVADRALVLTAVALRRVARDIDSICRTDATEFMLLVEGPCSHASAAKAAAQLLAKAMKPSDVLPIGAQLKLAIGMALLPDVTSDNQAQSAEEVLAWIRTRQSQTPKAPNQAIVSLNF